MTDFLADDDRALLARHGLDTFEALWAKELEAVDEPNTAGGGWSSVFRLDLEGQGYYLKRQSNYLTRTLHAPFGEPSFAREFRNISRYRKLGVPALQAAFFGERKINGEVRAARSRAAVGNPACLRIAGAASARRASGARLFLSQAYISAGRG